MKFTIKNADLLGLLSAAVSVSKAPDPIQIIAERTADLDAEPDLEERPAEMGRVRIIAFNETITSEWVRPADIRMTGSIAIRPEGLDRLVKASRNSDSTFTLETVRTDNADALRISTSRSAHEFPSEPADVFAQVTPGHIGGEAVDLSNLAQAIGTAKIAAAARGEAAGGRVMLTGVHLRERDGTYDVVGTDGKRLALVTLQSSEVGGLDLGAAGASGVTIPPEAIALITEMLKSGAARMEVVGKSVVVETAEGSLSVNVIDAPFPDYTILLKMDTDRTILVRKADLEMALQRSSVSLARDKRSVAVKMSRGTDGIHITSSADGQSSSECVSDEPGEEESIGFDARYMQGAIGAYGDGEISIDFAGDQVPIRITSKRHPGIRMLVMPCKT